MPRRILEDHHMLKAILLVVFVVAPVLVAVESLIHDLSWTDLGLPGLMAAVALMGLASVRRKLKSGAPLLRPARLLAGGAVIVFGGAVAASLQVGALASLAQMGGMICIVYSMWVLLRLAQRPGE